MASFKRSRLTTIACAIWRPAVLLAVLAVGSSAPAQTLTVCPDGSGDHATIQAAVAAAPAGAVIELCDGVYSGPGNRDVVLGDRFLTIRSASGEPDSCVIDCGGTELEPHRGFLVQAAAGLDTCAVIEGITVRNGWADAGGNLLIGSADGTSGPLLRDCRVLGAGGGAGIVVEEANLLLEECELTSNQGGNLLLLSGFCRAVRTGFTQAAGPGIRAGQAEGPGIFAVLDLLACDLSGNSGHGLSCGAWWELAADSCTFANNGGWGASGPVAESGSADLRHCRVLGNSGGGAWFGHDVVAEVADCEIASNGAAGVGSGLVLSFAFLQSATRCFVHDNGGNGVGLGWGAKRAAAPAKAAGPVTDCTILSNGGWGIVAQGYLFDLEVSGTLVAGNASGGCRFALDPDAPVAPAIRSSTIAANDGPGLEIASSHPVTIENTIIALNAGEAVAMPAASVPTLSCSDLYGNIGGDWTGPLAGQLGTGGNFSADPLFCDAAAFDFQVAADSPCAADGSPGTCGLVGALPVGCAAGFGIASVADVAGDQGLQARVIWWGEPNDVPGSSLPITRYIVWRRVDGAKRLEDRKRDELPAAALLPGEPVRLWAHVALWEPVGPEVPGMGWPRYASVVPTLADSTAAGIAWSVFMVSAHTADPQVFFLTDPDSGYSVDNLTPAAPLGFAVAYAAAGNALQWLPHPAPDVVAFRIYRDDGSGAPVLVHTESGTGWTDTVADPWRWRYRITAVDDSGLESPAALPGTVTDVPGGRDSLPARPILSGATPNPFNPRTVILYALPAGGAEVRLEVFDLRGRLLRRLEDGFREAGRHEAVWDGADARGRPLPAGTYFCRLRAAGASEVTKLSLVR